MKISFTVPCVPVAQPRQRHRVVVAHGKAFATNYTPKKDPVNSFKASVRHEFSVAYTGPPMNGPICLDVIFLMPRPGRLRWKSRAMLRSAHDAKPDLDNLTKAFLDALKGVAFVDDKQVWQLRVEKMYAAGDEPPGVMVTIED